MLNIHNSMCKAAYNLIFFNPKVYIIIILYIYIHSTVKYILKIYFNHIWREVLSSDLNINNLIVPYK